MATGQFGYGGQNGLLSMLYIFMTLGLMLVETMVSEAHHLKGNQSRNGHFEKPAS